MPNTESSAQGFSGWSSQKRLLALSFLVMLTLSLTNLYNIFADERRYLLEQTTSSSRDHSRQLVTLLQAYASLQCENIGENGMQQQSWAGNPLLASARSGWKIQPSNWSTSADGLLPLNEELLQLLASRYPGRALPSGIAVPVLMNDNVYMVSMCSSTLGELDGEWLVSMLPIDVFKTEALVTAKSSLVFSLQSLFDEQLQAEPPKGKPLMALPVGNTGWTLIAHEAPGYMAEQLADRLISPLILILVMALVILTSVRLLKEAEQSALRAERQRDQAEQRAELVLQSIEDALISTDANGVVNYYNQRAAELFEQHGKRDAMGQPLDSVWPHPRALWTHGLTARELEALQDHGRTLSVSSNGETRIMEQGYHPMYRKGELDGIVWLLRDISSSVRTRRELEMSRQRYISLFEDAGVAHWLLDTSEFDGTLKSLKLANANLAAVNQSMAANRPQLQLQFQELFPDAGETLLHCVEQLLDTQPTVVETDIQIRRFDDQIRDLSAHFSGSYDHRLMVTLIDVTEKRRASQRAREQETFWAAVMAAMPDTVMVADIDDSLAPRLIYCNRTAAETLGHPLPINTRDYDWYQYVASDECRNALQQALLKLRTLDGDGPLVFRGSFIDDSHKLRVMRLEFTPFRRTADGTVDRFISTARNITEEIAKQQQVVNSEARYRLVAENMTDIVWSTDIDLKFNFVSSSVERLLGFSSAEMFELGISSIFHKRDVRNLFREFKQRLRESLKSNPGKQHNVLIRRDIVARSKSGERFILDLQASLLWKDDGEMGGILGVCRDVTAARQSERELLLAAEVFENTNEAILVTDDKFHIVKVNRAFSDISGFRPEDVIGNTPETLLAAEHSGREFIEQMLESLVLNNYWQGELKFRCNNNDVKTSWTGISSIRDEHGHIQSLTIIMSDITERKVIEERIHKLAYYDALTGLANRVQMHERIDLMMRLRNNKGARIALLFIDLDRFKPINDSFGHPAGDKILIEVAQRLKQCVKRGDMVSRMGGDEFTICLHFPEGAEDVATTCQQVSERVLREINKPYYIDKHQLFLSASIGIALYPTDADSVIELLKNADMAMYHAKESGRNNLQFFNEEMNRRAVERMQLENDLHQVIQRKELYLKFQPQFDSRSLAPVGVETLLRWRHPIRGEVAPQEFVSILEDTGLIVPVGRWVLEQSCLQMAHWQAQNSSIELIAVNVSARQFNHPDFVSEVKNAILQAGISPHHLELELTESILIDDIDYTLALLSELRELGVRIAIDDFGTGYSSLNYLKQFPVDMLKIDKSFIQNLPSNRNDAQITRTIIAMAHNLGLAVIAEGVENNDQLDFLVRSRCEKIQGFLLSRPVHAEQLVDYLNTGAPEDITLAEAEAEVNSAHPAHEE